MDELETQMPKDLDLRIWRKGGRVRQGLSVNQRCFFSSLEICECLVETMRAGLKRDRDLEEGTGVRAERQCWQTCVTSVTLIDVIFA